MDSTRTKTMFFQCCALAMTAYGLILFAINVIFNSSGINFFWPEITYNIIMVPLFLVSMRYLLTEWIKIEIFVLKKDEVLTDFGDYYSIGPITMDPESRKIIPGSFTLLLNKSGPIPIILSNFKITAPKGFDIKLKHTEILPIANEPLIRDISNKKMMVWNPAIEIHEGKKIVFSLTHPHMGKQSYSPGKEPITVTIAYEIISKWKWFYGKSIVKEKTIMIVPQ